MIIDPLDEWIERLNEEVNRTREVFADHYADAERMSGAPDPITEYANRRGE